MATATMFTCSVFYNDVSFRIMVTAGNGGTKQLWLDLRRWDDLVRDGRTTDVERTVLASLTNGPVGRPEQMEVSREDLVVLKGIKDKLDGKPQPAAYTLPAAEIIRAAQQQNLRKWDDLVRDGGTKAKVHPLPEMGKVIEDKDAVSVAINTERQVMRGVHLTGCEMTDLEVQVNGLNKVIEVLAGDLWQLVYDIPVGSMDNPSAFLWSYGFRWTESVWILTDRSRKDRRMERMMRLWDEYNTLPVDISPEPAKNTRQTAAIEYHCKRLHPEEVQGMREIARNRLAARLVQVHQTLINRLATADAKLEEAEKEFITRTAQKGTVSWKERTVVQAKRDNAVRGLIRTVAKDLKAACDCAERFDETGNLKDLVDGLRKAIWTEMAAFNVHARAIQVTPVNVVV